MLFFCQLLCFLGLILWVLSPYSCVLFSLLVFAPHRRYSKFNSSVRLMYIAIVVTALSPAFNDNVFPVFC